MGSRTTLHQHTGPSTQRRPAPYLATLTLATLAVLVPVIAAAASPPAGHTWLGPLLIMLVAGARYAWVVGSAQRHLFEMSLWLFVYVFLGLAPFVQIRLGVDPPTTPNVVHALDTRASTLVLIGCLAAMVGSTLGGRRPAAVAAAPARALNWSRTGLLSGIMLVIAAAYLALVGVGPHLANRSALQIARTETFGAPTNVTVAAAVLSMGLLVSFVAQSQRRRERAAAGHRAPPLMIAATAATLLLCINPISSPRFVFGTVLLAMLVSIGGVATMVRYRVAALSAVAAFVFVFPLADAFRRSGAPDLNGDTLSALSGGDFDSFAQINNTVLYVSYEGITWMTQALGAALFWVPRGVWPGKPVDTGILLAHWRGYPFDNLSAPLFSELFINGGWPLLVVGMFGAGLLLRRLDDSAEMSLRSGGIPSVLATIAPFFMLIMLRGSLIQSMTYLAVILAGSRYVTSGSHRAPGGASPPVT